LSRFSIKLPQGQSFIVADLPLGEPEIKMYLDWSYAGSFYRVRLVQSGKDLQVGGKGLNPGVDLLEQLKLGIGKLYLEGAQPTLENLGLDNRLVYEPIQETVSN